MLKVYLIFLLSIFGLIAMADTKPNASKKMDLQSCIQFFEESKYFSFVAKYYCEQAVVRNALSTNFLKYGNCLDVLGRAYGKDRYDYFYSVPKECLNPELYEAATNPKFEMCATKLIPNFSSFSVTPLVVRKCTDPIVMQTDHDKIVTCLSDQMNSGKIKRGSIGALFAIAECAKLEIASMNYNQSNLPKCEDSIWISFDNDPKKPKSDSIPSGDFLVIKATPERDLIPRGCNFTVVVLKGEMPGIMNGLGHYSAFFEIASSRKEYLSASSANHIGSRIFNDLWEKSHSYVRAGYYSGPVLNLRQKDSEGKDSDMMFMQVLDSENPGQSVIRTYLPASTFESSYPTEIARVKKTADELIRFSLATKK